MKRIRKRCVDAIQSIAFSLKTIPFPVKTDSCGLGMNGNLSEQLCLLSGENMIIL